MQYLLRKHRFRRKPSPEAKLVLAGDLGGTHANIALAWAQNRQVGLIASFHFQTRALEGLYPPLREVTAYGEKKYGGWG
jgi:glucokinase